MRINLQLHMQLALSKSYLQEKEQRIRRSKIGPHCLHRTSTRGSYLNRKHRPVPTVYAHLHSMQQSIKAFFIQYVDPLLKTILGQANSIPRLSPHPRAFLSSLSNFHYSFLDHLLQVNSTCPCRPPKCITTFC